MMIDVKNIKKSNNLCWSDINIGHKVEFHRDVTKDIVDSFIISSKDFNPLHSDQVFSSKTIFKKPIVPGMLLSSFFSALVGVYLPGRDGLYLSQTLDFKSPVFIGDRVNIHGEVIDKINSLGLIYIKTEIKRENKIAVDGMAIVKHLNYEK